MQFILLTCILIVAVCCVKAELKTETDKSDITKLEVVSLDELESETDDKDSEVQRKRDSGYSYKRPDRFTVTGRPRFQTGQSGHKGRIVNRHPSQINRPVTKYGPPGYQSSPLAESGTHSHQHRDKFQNHGHFNQQHSNNFDGRPTGLLQQEVPSPIRHYDFAEANPIASQNNEPFGSNTANYLPPRNQKLPGYTAPHLFSHQHTSQGNSQGHSAELQSQNIVQSQEHQISDAALFLTQNAHAIQQLYGAPATNQDFAPNNDEFLDQNDQVQNTNAQLQNFESSSQNPFSGPLPSYASGTLNAQETLEQIQSLEKDRLIVQLQRALASQSQNAEIAGRYAQNQASFVQNQDLLASLGQQMKIHGLNTQQNTLSFGSGNTAFNQSPFLPGTTLSTPGFPLSYGLTTTTQAPTTTTTTSTTTGVTTLQPNHGTTGDGTSQVGASLPPPSQQGHSILPTSTGFPIYGGFVPTLITGTNFVANVPTYGPSFLAPGTITSVQTSGSSPTHFGLPIPTDQGQKPSAPSPSVPTTTPANIPSSNRPSKPSSPPVSSVPLPVHPIHPVGTPLHPIGTPLHPVATPVHPVTPLHPVLPATPSHVHPVQASPGGAAGHPTYGIHTSVVNPVLYKPIKPIYPLYYYPNVAYHLQKPVVPSYPWSYAPSYAQTKPAQIWK